jgi:pimeloyl-ACP methyl ester carboxylesterase
VDQVPAHPLPRGVDIWTPLDGVRLHARLLRPSDGAGAPIVMLHGLGVSSASLGPLAELLAARGHPVMACDLPGFGLTEADDVWPTDRIAAAIPRLLELRGLGRVILLGHSYGSLVAATVARDDPDRVAALVMLSPAFDRRLGLAGRPGPAPGARRAARAPLADRRRRPRLPARRPRRVLATLREASRIPVEDVIGATRAPTLVVRGSRDPVTTARWARELARRSRRGWVAQIPGAAHGLGHDAPVAAAAAVSAFLASI